MTKQGIALEEGINLHLDLVTWLAVNTAVIVPGRRYVHGSGHKVILLPQPCLQERYE